METEKPPVNNGKGLLDNIGLIDSLINDANNGVKMLINGQFLPWCGIMAQMGQKLLNLKKGVQNDISSRDDEIKELAAQIESLTNKIEILKKAGAAANGTT